MQLPDTEDAFVRALNPTGRVVPDYEPYYAADIADLGERPGRIIGRHRLADGREAVFRRADGSEEEGPFLWATVNGETAAYIGPMSNFVEVVTATEFAGHGLGRHLIARFVEIAGLVDMGGFTAAGDRAARGAWRLLQEGLEPEGPGHRGRRR